MKWLDFIVLRLIIFILAFVALSLNIDSFWLSLGLAFVVTLLLSLIIGALTDNRHHKDFTRYVNSMIIGGADSVFPEVRKVTGVVGEQKDNYLVCDNALIVCAVKFGNVTPDEIVRYYNAAKSRNLSDVYVIAKTLDRRTAGIMNNLDVNFIYIPLKHLYKLSKPEVEKTPAHLKRNYKAAFSLALSRSNVKRYLLTALVLAVMSLFTPLKIYYLVLSGIATLLAILCLTPIGDNSYIGKRGIFSKRVNDGEHRNADNSEDEDKN